MTSGSAASSGRLLLVATPLGNLGDITVRSLEALRSADAVLCEDTRRTGLLFKLLGITAPLQPYHAHNEHAVLTRVVEQIRNGRTVVLVSDAGTPGVSDPGFLLVRALLEQGLEVDVLPGPTALIPALLLSGFPCDRFVFEGFLPLKKGRKTRIESLRSESRTVILYESPHRILRTLGELKTALGPSVVLAWRGNSPKCIRKPCVCPWVNWRRSVPNDRPKAKWCWSSKEPRLDRTRSNPAKTKRTPKRPGAVH